MGQAVTAFSDAIDAWAAGLGWPLEALLRLALAGVAGGMIGVEREVRVRHAGFRTMLLVCLGSTLVMLVSVRMAYHAWPPLTADNRIVVDPGRIAYGIMTGVGFLGAGTIIERRGKARGLTTAAAIWCTAAIGMAMGLGLYVLGAATTLFVLLTLWLLDHLEDVLPVRRLREVTLRTGHRPGVVQDVLHLFETEGFRIHSNSLRREDDGRVEITLYLDYSARDDYLGFENRLEETQPGLEIRFSREI